MTSKPTRISRYPLTGRALLIERLYRLAHGGRIRTVVITRDRPGDYYQEIAPCGEPVWGTNRDIDSGLRHHIDFCEACQGILEQYGSMEQHSAESRLTDPDEYSPDEYREYPK